jgi:hypothetical protein
MKYSTILFLIILELYSVAMEVAVDSLVAVIASPQIYSLSLNELKNARIKSEEEKRVLFKQLQDNCSVYNAVQELKKIRNPDILIWGSDYWGNIEQGCIDWYRRSFIGTNELQQAVFWIPDFKAWWFLSQTEKQLLINSKSRPIAERLKNGESLQESESPLLTYMSDQLNPELFNGRDSRFKVLQSCDFFRWLCAKNGNIADAASNIQEGLCRVDLREESLRFTLNQIGCKPSFLNCFSVALQKNICDADFSQIFPLLQFYEGLYFCEKIIQNALKENKSECTIVFLLPNKEICYYSTPHEERLFEAFEKEVITIKNTITTQPLNIFIHFIPFVYGNDIYAAPYRVKRTSKKKLTTREIIELLNRRQPLAGGSLWRN